MRKLIFTKQAKPIINKHTIALAEKHRQLAHERCYLEFKRVIEEGEEEGWISKDEYQEMTESLKNLTL